MLRWIIGVFLVLCVGVFIYFIWPQPKPSDDCSFMTRTRTAGIDFQATVKKMDLVKGSLNLSTSDVRELDQILKDYAVKYETTCRDFKAQSMSSDEYSCRRQNMDKALDNVRLLSVTLDKATSAADKDVALKALESLKGFAQADYKTGCGASITVNPQQLQFGVGMPERSIRITNGGNRAANFSVGDLPEWFLPSPSSGAIPPGQTVAVAIVRTLLPVQKKVIGFAIRDNWNNEIQVEASVSEENETVYEHVAEDLNRTGKTEATVSDVLELLDRQDPTFKDSSARMVVASNVLAASGNLKEASVAAQQAFHDDRTLQTNPNAQINLAVINTKLGAHAKADENFAAAQKYAGERKDFQSTLRVVGTAAAVKQSVDTGEPVKTPITDQTGPLTKIDTQQNASTVHFVEKQFGLKKGAVSNAAIASHATSKAK
jgi:hypothetical protein